MGATCDQCSTCKDYGPSAHRSDYRTVVELCSLHASAPDLLAALEAVQEALACFRDDEDYKHPTHGTLALEEVKYVIVDPAIDRAKRRARAAIARARGAVEGVRKAKGE